MIIFQALGEDVWHLPLQLNCSTPGLHPHAPQSNLMLRVDVDKESEDTDQMTTATSKNCGGVWARHWGTQPPKRGSCQCWVEETQPLGSIRLTSH